MLLPQDVSLTDGVRTGRTGLDPPLSHEQVYSAGLEFVESFATLMSVAGRISPDAFGVESNMERLRQLYAASWIWLPVLLSPRSNNTLLASRIAYPPGSPLIRVGELPGSASYLEVVIEHLATSFRNVLYQNRRCPADESPSMSGAQIVEQVYKDCGAFGSDAVGLQILAGGARINLDDLGNQLTRESAVVLRNSAVQAIPEGPPPDFSVLDALDSSLVRRQRVARRRWQQSPERIWLAAQARQNQIMVAPIDADRQDHSNSTDGPRQDRLGEVVALMRSRLDFLTANRLRLDHYPGLDREATAGMAPGELAWQVLPHATAVAAFAHLVNDTRDHLVQRRLRQIRREAMAFLESMLRKADTNPDDRVKARSKFVEIQTETSLEGWRDERDSRVCLLREEVNQLLGIPCPWLPPVEHPTYGQQIVRQLAERRVPRAQIIAALRSAHCDHEREAWQLLDRVYPASAAQPHGSPSPAAPAAQPPARRRRPSLREYVPPPEPHVRALHRTILEWLDARGVQSIQQIVTGISRSTSAVTRAVMDLNAWGYAHWPPRSRKGASIRDRGREYLQGLRAKMGAR